MFNELPLNVIALPSPPKCEIIEATNVPRAKFPAPKFLTNFVNPPIKSFIMSSADFKPSEFISTLERYSNCDATLFVFASMESAHLSCSFIAEPAEVCAS